MCPTTVPQQQVCHQRAARERWLVIPSRAFPSGNGPAGHPRPQRVSASSAGPSAVLGPAEWRHDAPAVAA